MKTVLITGGAGYIGTVMVAELLKVGYKVKVLDRMFFGFEPIEKYRNHPNFELIKNDIRYFDSKLLDSVYAVFDLAGIANDPSCDIDPEATISINHLGCVRVAKLAKEMGVERYILASSCSVYGGGRIGFTHGGCSKKTRVTLCKSKNTSGGRHLSFGRRAFLCYLPEKCYSLWVIPQNEV